MKVSLNNKFVQYSIILVFASILFYAKKNESCFDLRRLKSKEIYDIVKLKYKSKEFSGNPTIKTKKYNSILSFPTSNLKHIYDKFSVGDSIAFPKGESLLTLDKKDTVIYIDFDTVYICD